jgi:leader peptidase (prepilin peptidase)/N-methyltransferase
LGWEFALYVIMAYWVLLLAAIDIEHHRLPNVLTWSGMVVGFLINLGWYFAGGAAITTTPAANWQGVWFGAIVDPSIWAGWEFMAPTFSPLHSMLGVLVGGGILMLIATLWRGAMGWGDVKFLAAIGAFLGPGAALLVLFAGSLLGSIIGVTLILTKKVDRRQPIPFGPFMSTAVLILAILG